jgi:hypothetical protein
VHGWVGRVGGAIGGEGEHVFLLEPRESIAIHKAPPFFSCSHYQSFDALCSILLNIASSCCQPLSTSCFLDSLLVAIPRLQQHASFLPLFDDPPDPLPHC